MSIRRSFIHCASMYVKHMRPGTSVGRDFSRASSVVSGFSPASRVIVRKHRFCKQNRRHGKTRRRHLLFTAMALGPRLVLAEVAGFRVLSTLAVAPPPLFASPALPAAAAHR